MGISHTPPWTDRQTDRRERAMNGKENRQTDTNIKIYGVKRSYDYEDTIEKEKSWMSNVVVKQGS